MLMRLLARFFASPDAPAVVKDEPKEEKGGGLHGAVHKARMQQPDVDRTCYPTEFPVQPPVLMSGVVPAGEAPAVAMDSAFYQYANSAYGGQGFPGYPYLAQLALRPEYRNMAAALATELTREWIELSGADDDAIVDAQGRTIADKIKAIEEEFKRLNVRGVISQAAEHDALYGRGQIFVKLKGHDASLPLLLDKRTIAPGSLERLSAVEAMWTTPSSYDANDPSAPNFYKPSEWFMVGQKVHASRMLTVITRPVPDMLKPAFNFGGVSLSQLAEPYVNNWLRTRQSVSDLINNFSITALATSMDQVLSGHDNGDDLFKRAELFTLTRSNRGIMLLDKEHEELVQINTPLSGLHELQAQSQEHLCSVSRMPATILTGIQPSGLNATGEGEQDAWYDWVAAQQEAHYRQPLETILQIVQLSLFGEVDKNITLSFRPLFQMTPEQEAGIREKDANRDTAYIDAGVLSPLEVRERLARDVTSGYHGLDANVLPEPPGPSAEEIAAGLLGGGGEPPGGLEGQEA